MVSREGGWLIVTLIGKLLAGAALIVACASNDRPVDESADAQVPAIAFTGASVLSADGASFLPDHTVVTRGDRIVAVGPAGTLSIPDGARTVSARGRFLIPGLADMHVHLEHFDREEQLLLFLTSGVTTVRHMDGRPRELRWRQRIADGELLGPTIHMAGQIIDSEPRSYDQTTVVTSAAHGAAAVREQAADGYDFIKVYHRLQPEAYRAILEAAGGFGLRVAGHVPEKVGLAGVLEAGQDSIEHLYGYGEEVLRSKPDDWAPRWMVGELDRSALASWSRRTAQAGTWNCPTLMVRLAARPPEQAQRLYDSQRMALVPPTMKEGWNYQYYAYAVKNADYFSALPSGIANRRTMVKALFDAGAPLLAGTDTPNLFVEPGAALHRELQEFVSAGLAPADVLRIATAGAAAFLGQADEFGVIRPGARADLVVLGADPLQDIGALAAVEGVMARGRWLDAEELAARTASLVAAYGRPASDLASWRPAALGGLRAEPDARHVVRLGKFPVAEERIWLGDSLVALAWHEEADDPDIAVRVQLSDHERETARDIWLHSSEGEGRLRLQARPMKDAAPQVRWTLDGTSASGEPVALNVEAPADANVISLPSTVSATLLRPRVERLAIGNAVKVPAVVLTFRPDISLEAASLEIQRLADRRTEGNRPPHRAYRVAVGYDERVLVVDERFRPIRMEEELPFDTLTWSEVP